MREYIKYQNTWPFFRKGHYGIEKIQILILKFVGDKGLLPYIFARGYKICIMSNLGCLGEKKQLKSLKCGVFSSLLL